MAVCGELENKRRIRRWDVLPQQVISYIRQNRGSGRSQLALQELAGAVWRESSTPTICAEAIRKWMHEGRLEERRGRLHLAGAWDRFAEQAEDDATIHSNINSTGVALAVRDELTGELIGQIERLEENQRTITLAGKAHRIVYRDDEIAVTPIPDRAAEAKDDTPNYGGRRRPITESFAAHVGRGCGFEEGQAPVVQSIQGALWFHFGGELFATMLRVIFPHYVLGSALPGIALRVVDGFEAVERSKYDALALERFISRSGLRLLSDDGLGRFAPDLPVATAEAFLEEHQLVDRFTEWLSARTIAGLAAPDFSSTFGAVVGLAIRGRRG